MAVSVRSSYTSSPSSVVILPGLPWITVCSDRSCGMVIVGHTDYQTTANIYTHIRDEMLKKSTVNMGDVFRKREE